MQKHQQLKATWLNDVKSALHTYRRQHFPSAKSVPATKDRLSVEGEHTAKTLVLLERHIKDTKSLIRHSRTGHGDLMSTMGACETPGGTLPKQQNNSPAARHYHAKALHQYKRKLAQYEHLKEMLRKDGISA